MYFKGARALSVSNLGIEGLDEVEQIGTGGSSRVYRALQADLDRVVAVKVINSGHDADVARRFDRERKAMGRLSNHEGIVPVYSSGVTALGDPFLVMPYYPNGSLQDQIDAGPLDWQSAVGYVDVAAETIAAAHEQGVVHLDIKPANILVTNTGSPRIADFGIAKLSSSTGIAARTTGTAFTPTYSAPETFLEGEASPAADVYGLGATLWALLVGHPPFLAPGEDANLMAVIGRVVNNPLGDVRHLAPEPVCRVISQAMAKSPTERFQTAREFSLALKGAMAQSGLAPGAAAVAAGEATALHQFTPPVPYGGPPPANGDPTQVFVGHAPPAPIAAPVVASARTVDGFPPPPVAEPQMESRLLLQPTADSSRYAGGPAPIVERTPLIDLDQFRFGPVVVGLVALLGVGLLAAWALTRGGDTEPASGVASLTESAPAGPDLEQPTTASTIDLSSTLPSTIAESTTSSTDQSSTTSTSQSTSTETTAATTTSTTTSTTASTTTTTTTTTTTSASSSTSSSSVPVGPLQPPENVSAVFANGMVTLSWTPPSSGPQPTSYIVYRDSQLLVEVPNSPYVDTGLSPGTYRYRVASLGPNATESDLSPAATVEVPTPVPLDVTLSLSTSTPTSITIQVTSNPCMDTLRVSWKVAGSSDAPDIATPPLGGCVTSDSYRITGLSPNTDYQINVTAVGPDGGTGNAIGVFSTG